MEIESTTVAFTVTVYATAPQRLNVYSYSKQ